MARQTVTRMFEGARQSVSLLTTPGKKKRQWISGYGLQLIAGAVVALLLLFFVVGTPGRRRAAKREQAERLRQEAEEKLRSAAGRDAAARQEEVAAERERLAAQEQLQEADAVDPDLPAQAARPDATVRPEAADETA
jgi:flagellar biosynthesis/type III secretory pathway M-ring protein FliF/YscJ